MECQSSERAVRSVENYQRAVRVDDVECVCRSGKPTERLARRDVPLNPELSDERRQRGRIDLLVLWMREPDVELVPGNTPAGVTKVAVDHEAAASFDVDLRGYGNAAPASRKARCAAREHEYDEHPLHGFLLDRFRWVSVIWPDELVCTLTLKRLRVEPGSTEWSRWGPRIVKS